MKLSVLDLFSGIGGFSLGLERAGMTTVAFVEINPYCQAVLRKHWPKVPIHGDIKTRKFKEGEADVVCGGFPCQDISFAGKGAGITGPNSGLWREMHRAIGVVRPKVVIIENVAALLIRGLSVILFQLAEIGYDAQWHCIPASYVGAPHRRDRIFIIAYPKGGTKGFPILFNCQRQTEKRQKNSSPSSGRRLSCIGSQEWNSEPRVCRVVNGISSNVDRTSALGNAVVPQVVEVVGRAIVQALRKTDKGM